MKKKCKSIKGLLGGLIILLGIMNGQTILAQQINITGKVTLDQTNEALAGATVSEKGTSNGVLTDAGGGFSLQVKDANSILVFSFVGLEPQEVVVAGQKVINVSMKESVSQLDEVIVTGYQNSKKG